MRSKAQIIEELAKARKVEQMVENICHNSLTADLQDLCQMVYLILLEYDEDKILDLYENNQMSFFIARIILNQYRTSNSPFHNTFRKYQERFVGIGNLCETEMTMQQLIEWVERGKVENENRE